MALGMNYQGMFYIIGWLLKIEGYLMLLPFFVGIFYQEESAWDFLLCTILAVILGKMLSRKKPTRNEFYAREGYLSVAIGWIVMSLIGALPFFVSGEIPSFVDAIFEVVSGFTTTGASILNDVEALSHGMLFWRSFTHWIGGMGVLVFLMAILPLAGAGHNMQLMRAESPGPSVSKLVPKIKNSAMMLYGIYLILTCAEFLLLAISRMPIFDAICITFGTAGTGGFGVRNTSCSDYTAFQQNVITVFMLLFGVNFNFYFLLSVKKWRDALRIEEVRWYFAIYFSILALIVGNLVWMGKSFFYSLHHAAFSAASVMTTTGFATVDFDQWPELSKLLLLFLMGIGACAGSTGGGIKVSRVLIYIKSVGKELSCLLHPRSVKIIKMEGKKLEHEILRETNVFLVAYIAIFLVSILIISAENHDFSTNFTSVLATFNNIGPGLSMVGPTQNFSFFSDRSKIVLMFDMLAGRLEIFPMLLLITPKSWK